MGLNKTLPSLRKNKVIAAISSYCALIMRLPRHKKTWPMPERAAQVRVILTKRDSGSLSAMTRCFTDLKNA